MNIRANLDVASGIDLGYVFQVLGPKGKQNIDIKLQDRFQILLEEIQQSSDSDFEERVCQEGFLIEAEFSSIEELGDYLLQKQIFENAEQGKYFFGACLRGNREIFYIASSFVCDIHQEILDLGNAFKIMQLLAIKK